MAGLWTCLIQSKFKPKPICSLQQQEDHGKVTNNHLLVQTVSLFISIFIDNKVLFKLPPKAKRLVIERKISHHNHCRN